MDEAQQDILENVLMMAESMKMTKDEMLLATHIGNTIREDVIETVRQMQLDHGMSYDRACAILIMALATETMGLTAAREAGK